MKMRKISLVILCLICLLGLSYDVSAQCAMCQATVESNIDNGGTAGKGLNNGIMYLLAAPYLAMAGIGYLWYKKFRKKDVAINIKEEKINLN